jgi:hemolysin activation/secretion protein
MLGWIAVLSGVAGLAQAQVVPNAGSTLREQQKPQVEVPSRTAPSIRIDEPARPALKPSTVRFVLRAFRIQGNTVFSQQELLALVQDYVGRSVGFSDLQAAAARISRFYRERGYLVARAYLPAQEIKEGTVEIAVIEGRFGKVSTVNHSRVRDGVVRGYLDRLPGGVVTESTLERQLLLLNDLAGVAEAHGSLSAGTNVGESDLAVELKGAPLLSGSLEYDNYGNRFTGASRVTGRLNVASPLGLGDALSVRATHGFDGLDYGRLVYQVPVGGDGWRLGGAYSTARYQLGQTFAPLAASGDSNRYTLNASYPFVRSRGLNLYGQASYDASDFQDRVGATATVTDKNTRVANVSFSGDSRDDLGGGGVTVFLLNYRSGRLDIESPGARAVDEASAQTNGHYGVWNFNALRLQSLGEHTSLYLSFASQFASKNLDSSEKFILGGPEGVRAYPLGEALGDSGYEATAELRYVFTATALPGVVQPFLFVDTGRVNLNENPFAAGTNHRRLTGGGIGISWLKVDDFQVKVSIATRLGDQPVTSDTNRRTRGWLQAIKYF